ncbi:MAG: RNase H family protein [Myxococcota bacterium]
MPWKRAMFKGKKIWAEVDELGRPQVTGGRLPIRYSDGANARIYRAGAAGVSLLDTAPEALPDGAPADDGSGGKSTRRSRGSGFGSAGSRTQAQAQAARSAAADLIAGFHRDAVLCFTDGACRGNPGPAGAGAVVKLPDGTTLERHKALGRATNNVGELTAIGLAMDLLDEAAVDGDARIEIMTDSKYAHGLLMLGWKGKANRELVNRLRARKRDFPNLRVHWIAGHVGIPENERADALANLGVDESARRGPRG